MRWSSRLLFRLRRRFPAFREERFLGRLAIRARAYVQLAGLAVRSTSTARLCLRVVPRHTMIAPRLLFAMHDLAADVARRGVLGDVVECGVWNGGSLALLARAMGGTRDAWAFDSFEGLPPPTEKDPEIVRANFFRGWNAGSPARVAEAWARCGLDPHRLHVVPGWFEETFPRADVRAIAVLHIDADWHDSVRLCLDRWYDRMSPGGVVILNDWNLYAGADKAVADFLAKRAPGTGIRPLGRVGGWFICRNEPGTFR
ncbi:MAG TPA: TylF/MycF/NovP-related O-methyltransferase [Planctomycetota bacterium]|nr:TylF/MycF/NovP-related O-methyltransferase [Planctomycetota bacterium]